MINQHSKSIKQNTDQAKLYESICNALEEVDLVTAEELLNLILPDDRDAEWHFFYGSLLTHKGWFHDAQMHFKTACELSPENEEYQEAATSLQNSANGYTDTWVQSSDLKSNEKKESKNCLSSSILCEGCCECLCECICDGICDGIS